MIIIFLPLKPLLQIPQGILQALILSDQVMLMRLDLHPLHLQAINLLLPPHHMKTKQQEAAQIVEPVVIFATFLL